MPPRKSNSRKSDTSTARFVPMDDVSPLEQSPAAPAPTQADAPAPAPATAPAGSEIVAAEGEAGSSPVQTTEKNKDKDKEKEKEHKEHITIEVGQMEGSTSQISRGTTETKNSS